MEPDNRAQSVPMPWALAPLTRPKNPDGGLLLAILLPTDDIFIQLPMDSTVSPLEICASITALVFATAHHRWRGPLACQLLDPLVAALDATSSGWVI